jgi:hypothetical protein
VFSPQKDTLHAQVLLACALAKVCEFGYFSAITGKNHDIPGFSSAFEGL